MPSLHRCRATLSTVVCHDRKNEFLMVNQVFISPFMKKLVTSFGITLLLGGVTGAILVATAYGADAPVQPSAGQNVAPGAAAARPAARMRAQPKTRLPTDPGTPALIPAGPN